MQMKKIVKLTLLLTYLIFITISLIYNYHPGKIVANNLFTFSKDMITIIPCAYILIGLFEVWVKKETVEKHLGEKSIILGYVWAILLASTTVGGLYVAFPVSYTLYSKGARLSVIFTYLGAVSVCRIPMTVFEASFMGWKFTTLRLLISLPLIILTSILFEIFLKKRNYQIKKGS